MTRLALLIFSAALGSTLLGCGSNATSATADPVSLVPASSALSAGWSVDTTNNPSGQPMVATTKVQAVNLIDGAASPFYKTYTPTEFVEQNYVNKTLPFAPPGDPNANPQGATAIVYIWEMPSADQAAGLYQSLLDESEYSGNWQTTQPPLGTESRIEDTKTQWWVNFHEGVFYAEVFLNPSFGSKANGYAPSDPDLKNEAMKFAEAIANNPKL